VVTESECGTHCDWKGKVKVVLTVYIDCKGVVNEMDFRGVWMDDVDGRSEDEAEGFETKVKGM
jgi:hypothetical protein